MPAITPDPPDACPNPDCPLCRLDYTVSPPPPGGETGPRPTSLAKPCRYKPRPQPAAAGDGLGSGLKLLGLATLSLFCFGIGNSLMTTGLVAAGLVFWLLTLGLTEFSLRRSSAYAPRPAWPKGCDSWLAALDQTDRLVYVLLAAVSASLGAVLAMTGLRDEPPQPPAIYIGLLLLYAGLAVIWRHNPRRG